MHEEYRYWLALWRVPGVGGKCFQQVLKRFGSLSEVFRLPQSGLLALGFTVAQAEEINAFGKNKTTPVSKGVAADLAWLEGAERHLICVNDPLYSALLQQIPNHPPLLFVQGDPALLNWPQIAMVGSRNATRQGLHHAENFACHFVKQGYAVTSGLALGIDAAAHRGALQGDGPTVAVLAHGLDKIYPQANRRLAAEILEQGALISEFPIGVTPRPSYFPRRNRIISGLSLAVLVVEAAIKSGSLITARLALQQNREVFALPGALNNPLAKGCHALIREGAKLVEQGADVCDELLPLLGYQRQQLQLSLARADKSLESNDCLVTNVPAYDKTSPESQIINVLDNEPMLVDELVVRTGIAVAELNAALVMLELDGMITNQQGGYTLAT